jgi:CheY-like chemotaxis protein
VCTPLQGLQLSIALLSDSLQGRLNPQDVELMATASTCATAMARIFHATIENLRGDDGKRMQALASSSSSNCRTMSSLTDLVKCLHQVCGLVGAGRQAVGYCSSGFTGIHSFLTDILSLHAQVMAPIQKRVPMIIELNPSAPTILVVNDLAVFRTALSVLSVACSQTYTGFVRLHIFGVNNSLVFECEATAPIVLSDIDNVEELEQPELQGLRDAAALLTDVQGKCGFRKRTSEGFVFWFSVPNPIEEVVERSLCLKPDKDLLTDAIFEPPPETARRPKYALIVDDSLVVRKTLTRALSILGYSVELAENGMQGLVKMQERPFDVVLCDFLMPVMDGMDCVKQYRAWEEQHRPWFRQYILGFSAHASPLDSQKGIEAGMDHFQPKPVSRDTLKEILETSAVKKQAMILDRYASSIDFQASCAGDVSTVSLDESEHSRRGVKRVRSYSVTDTGLQQREGTDKRERVESPVDEEEEDELASTDSNGGLFVAEEDDSLDPPPMIRHCLVVTSSTEESTTAATPTALDVARMLVENGWICETTSNGNTALELLRLRNWDAVVLDGSNVTARSNFDCVQIFREWESQNRVNRQNNVFYQCPSNCPFKAGNALALPPRGMDGVLPTAPSWEEFDSLLVKTGVVADMYVITR